MKVLKKIFFTFLPLIFLFIGAEVSLRLLGFRYQRHLSYMQFGYPDPSVLHQVFELDPELLYRMKPGYDFGKEFGPLNQQGFRGKNFERIKPPEVFRIACLGDSVTFGTPEGSYPEILEQILKREFPDRKIQAYNFGVPGYSSFQGKNLLARVLKEYQPNLVVISYVWNDHWLAQGFSDSEQKMPKELALLKLRDQLSRFRVYQVLNKLVVKFFQKIFSVGEKKFRVPLEEYQKNLSEMVAQARSQEAEVILATAPGGFGLGTLPDFLEMLGFVQDASLLWEIHQEYNEAVRRVAEENQVRLMDLDLLFQKQGVKNFFDQPAKDIIHPNRAGLELMAQAFAGMIREMIKKEEKNEQD